MLRALKRLFTFGRGSTGLATGGSASLATGGSASLATGWADGTPAPWTLRRWEAAESNRLNRAHWKRAADQSINCDLAGELSTLRARCALEISNNPILEGVLRTYADDVAGRNGPTLQVQSDDEAYDDALEAVWRAWWREPDATGQLGGVDFLKLWVRRLWDCGEFLAQLVSAAPSPGLARAEPVTLRIRSVHPRRLATPFDQAGREDVTLGVRRSEDGAPLAYYIAQPVRVGDSEFLGTTYRTLDAAGVLHRFIPLEEDQARGVPWLATPLQSGADLRDYDAQVLDAARQAADQAVFWYADHPDAQYLEVNESVEIERRMQQTGPPGWKPMQLTPQQPGVQYLDYRSERHREWGRPVGMPLMMVRLDSSKHNYSSARFDGQIYQRGLDSIQGWLERRTLEPLLAAVEQEARLYAAANPRWEHAAALRRRPRGGLQLAWIWPRQPHVDPKKEGDAERTGIETGTVTYAAALAARGADEDSVIASRARTNRKLAAAGLPPLPVPAAPQATPGAAAAADEADDEAAGNVGAAAAR